MQKLVSQRSGVDHNIDACMPFRLHISAALFSLQEPADIFFISIYSCLESLHPSNLTILLPFDYIIIFNVFFFLVQKLGFPSERVISLAFDVISHVLETGPVSHLASLV